MMGFMVWEYSLPCLTTGEETKDMRTTIEEFVRACKLRVIAMLSASFALNPLI